MKSIDNKFFNTHTSTEIDENVVYEYFNYIKPKINSDSVFRLLSPLLQIFFGIPNSKKFKSKIHLHMQNKELGIIEGLILDFVKENNYYLN